MEGREAREGGGGRGWRRKAERERGKGRRGKCSGRELFNIYDSFLNSPLRGETREVIHAVCLTI